MKILDHWHCSTAFSYACRKFEWAAAVYFILSEPLNTYGHSRFYKEVELPVLSSLAHITVLYIYESRYDLTGRQQS